jgi:hypothetical protein
MAISLKLVPPNGAHTQRPTATFNQNRIAIIFQMLLEGTDPLPGLVESDEKLP